MADAQALVDLPVGAHTIAVPGGAAASLRHGPLAGNLVTNGNFETDTTGWTAQGNGTIARDATVALIGSASLKVIRSAQGGGDTVARSDAMDVYPHVAYVLEGYIRSSATTKAVLAVGWYDEDDNLVRTDTLSYTATVSSPDEFRYVGQVFDAPWNAHQARIILQETDDPATPDDVWFDGLRLNPTVPLAVDPFTMPAIEGDSGGDALTFQPNIRAHRLGDVRVWDMGAQTDPLADTSNFTRVYGLRHQFSGALLVECSNYRLHFDHDLDPATDMENPRINLYIYDGAAGWIEDAFGVMPVPAGISSDSELANWFLVENAPGRCRIRANDSLGNPITVTCRRGIPSIKVSFRERVVGSGAHRFQLSRPGATSSTGYTGETRFPFVIGNGDGRGLTDSSIDEESNLFSSTGFWLLGAWGPGQETIVGIATSRNPPTGWSEGRRFSTPDEQRLTWIGDSVTEDTERHFWVVCNPWPWGRVRHFVEAEDDIDGVSSGGATPVADADASGGNAMELSPTSDFTAYRIFPNRDLPPGTYTLYARVRNANGGSIGEVDAAIWNDTASTYEVDGANAQPDSTYEWDADDLTDIVKVDFTVGAADDGDEWHPSIEYVNATGTDDINWNVDWMVIIPRRRRLSEDSPSHAWFPGDTGAEGMMEVSARSSIRRMG